MPNRIRIKDQPENVHLAVLIFGNTLRLGILRQLYLGKNNRTDIAKALGVTEVSLTRQMSTLVENDLVTSTILREQGRPVRYSINKDAVQNLFNTMDNYWHGKALPIEDDSLA